MAEIPLAVNVHFRSIGNYVVSHWRGEQPLFLSFWINLVALRVLIFQFQSGLAPRDGENYSEWRLLIIVGAVLFHGVLLTWQMVGVVRSADRHFQTHGNMALVWGAQLGATIMFLLAALYSLEAVQMTFVHESEADRRAALALNRVAGYQLSVSPDQTQMIIDGIIEPGITRAAKQLMEVNPAIQQVSLNSEGGNIFEGRGLSLLFATHKLNTHVEETCASACTSAYIGGQSRSAGAQARFGFHQYRVDGGKSLIVTTTVIEQQRDQELFLQAGVKGGFVRKIFDHPAEAMWWPSLTELLGAGVVHEVASP